MKHSTAKVILFVSFAVLVCIAASKNASKNPVSAFGNLQNGKATIILDAGHGGEDGGAVAPDGTNEKDINLAIVKDISALFEIFGIDYIPVRTEDISVGDNNLSTLAARKKSDIRNREKLVNSTPGAVFFSIHQNKFEIPKYKGTQVFYGAGNPESELIAQCVQEAVVARLQKDNTRQIKPSGDSIYLLYKAKAPSVMTECGFLSNPEELVLLKSDEYQKKMAYSVYCGLQTYLNSKEITKDGSQE